MPSLSAFQYPRNLIFLHGGVDALQNIIRLKGRHCNFFKLDLSRAYRQLRIDPRDYHLLGFRHHGSFYVDIAPPFGLRSSAMMCQRTTNAVTFMFQELGYHCTNYTDDFGGAETPDKSAAAFQTLGSLLANSGLDTSCDKASPPATVMVFLGVLVNTERLQELLSLCSLLLSVDHISCTELQSLLRVILYVTARVNPARVYVHPLAHSLRPQDLCCLSTLIR